MPRISPAYRRLVDLGNDEVKYHGRIQTMTRGKASQSKAIEQNFESLSSLFSLGGFEFVHLQGQTIDQSLYCVTT
jgi:hypothetical protein